MEQENNSKGLTARILGEQPTALQKTFVGSYLMAVVVHADILK